MNKRKSLRAAVALLKGATALMLTPEMEWKLLLQFKKDRDEWGARMAYRLLRQSLSYMCRVILN